MSKNTTDHWVVTRCVCCPNGELLSDLLEAASAARKYYEALTGRASNGDFKKSDWGGITTGQDLDDLFNDWAEKSHKALAKAEGKS